MAEPGARRAFAGAAVLAVLVLALAVLLAREGGSAQSPARVSAGSASVSTRAGRSHAHLTGLAALPAAARGPVSAALGAGGAAYQVSPASGGFQAANAPQRLRARFGGAGVQIDSAGLRLKVSPATLRAGGYRQALAGVAPRASANRVTFARGPVSEWYVNGPLGLEQGFTISRAAAVARSAAQLTLSLPVAGNARASISAGSQSVTFAHSGSSSLRYYDLTATDAGGRTLHSWLTLRGDTVLVHVDAAGARYPLTIDPLIALSEQLTGAGEQGDGRFGFSVALSADGDTALIGAPRDDGFAGAAWVFVRSGSVWAQQGELTGEESGGHVGEQECSGGPGEPGEGGTECGFGASVALSGDGNTALVGAPRGNERRGAAWVFTRTGSTWSKQGEQLTGGTEERGRGRFGRAVALSGDGDTALIGAPYNSAARGAAWVFTRTESGWTQGEKLSVADEQRTSYFGRSVALSADGDTALIGAPGSDEHVGAAWIFTRAGAAWGTGEPLTGAGERGSGHFGSSVALSGDGATALVGAREDDGGLGAVWAFDRTGAFWGPGDELTAGPGETEPGQFGYSVALSSNGETALIGAPNAASGHGGARLLTRTGTTWTPDEALEAPEGRTSRRFGASVALSSNGSVVLIGGPLNLKRVGRVWASAPAGPPPPPPARPAVNSIAPSSGPTTGGTEVRITGSGFLAGASVDIGSAAASVDVVSETEILATTSSAPAGEDEVVVADAHGTSSGGPRYTYVEPTGSPSAGPSAKSADTSGGGNGEATGATAGASVPGAASTVLPPPQLTVSADVTSFSGTVLVKLPGSSKFVQLTSGTRVPFGTIIDATHGRVTITTVLPNGTIQTVTLFAGEFMLTQQRNGTVVIALEGGSFSVCPTAKERSHLARASANHPTSGSHVVRKLWASGHGKYTTKGNYASGAVQGTEWLTEDLCDGTLIAVTRDSVLVTNLVNHKHFLIKVHHHFLAKAP